MTRFRTLTITTLAAIGLLATTTAAFAGSVTATAAVNVRSGPGTGYGIVDTLTPGEEVNVTECVANGWCHIQHPGPDGWVSGNYLSAGGGASPKPDCDFGIAIGPGGPAFGIQCGEGPGLTIAPPAPPAPPADKVCFYKGANYSGQKFCVSPGTSDNALPANWNDKISSIEITGTASVKVCRNFNYAGGCATYGSSKPNLPFGYTNKISSFKAF